MISLLLSKKILSLFIIMLMGVFLVKSKLVSSENSKCLSIVSLYVITPCVILSSFQIDYTPDIQAGFILAFIAAILVHIVFIIFTKFFGLVFHLNRLERATTIYSNAGSLIIPIVSSVLGTEWVIYTTPFVAVQLFLIWSHGKILLSGDNHIEFLKIFKNINMIFIFIGILLFVTNIRFPPVVQDAISSTGEMIGPLVMLVTGILIGSMDWRKVLSYRRLWLVTALRLIIFPVIIIAVFYFIRLPSFTAEGTSILFITLLATSTPSSAGLTQMAMIYGDDPEYSSAINVVTTLLCIITIPAVIGLYGVVFGI